MPIFERPYDTSDELHADELGHLKVMFESGTTLAVSAAMSYCAKHGLNPPRWLVVGSEGIHLAERRKDVPKKRGGRSSGVVSRYRQDAKDYVRWDAVVEIQDQRRLLQNEIDTLRALKGHPAKKLLEQRIKSLDWAGSKKEVSLEVAYDRASTLLANTPASDKEDAMKRSYNTVQENMRTPATAMRYHILDPEFLSRFRAPTK